MGAGASAQVCYPTSITRSEDGTELKKIRKAQSLSEYRAAVRNLLKADYEFLDEIQVGMSSARQFLFAIRTIKRQNFSEKSEQFFNALNRADKAICEHGFTAKRLDKSEIKRMLSLYFGTSITGEEIPDIEGENEFDLEEKTYEI